MKYARRLMQGIGLALMLPVTPLLAAAITVENSAVHYDGDNGTAVNSLTNFTVAAGSDRKLVVTMNFESASSLTNLTYGSQVFTKAVATGNVRAAQIWYLDAPAVGTADIVAMFDGNARSLMTATSLQDTAPGISVSNKEEGAGASTNSLTTTESDTFVIGTYTENGAVAITNTPFATELHMGNSGSSVSQIGYQNEAVAGLKTYVWSHAESSGASAVAGFAPPTTENVVIVAGSASNYDGNSSGSTNTLSGFTVSDGDDRKLVLSINSEAAGTISTITYGSQSFIPAVKSNTAGRYSQIWYLDNPEVGTADIVAIYTLNGRSRMGVVSLQNTAAGVNVINSVGSGATNLVLTTTEADTFVIGSYIDNSAGPVTGPFASTLYNGDSGSSFSDAGYQNEAVAGAKNYAWTTAADGAIALAGFAPPPPPGVIYVANSTSNSDGNSSTSNNTISAFSVTAGKDLKLVLSINSEAAGTISTITYGSQSFVPAVKSSESGRLSQIWYLDAPEVGTADIVATYTLNGRSQMGVVSLQNAAVGVNVINSVVSGATNLVLTTTEANTFVVGSYIQNGSGPVANSFASTLFNGDSGSSFSDAGYQNEAVAGAKDYTWTTAADGGIALAGFAAAELPTGGELYDEWSLDYGLTNGTESLTADPDDDGMKNLTEYGLGGNPTNSDAASILPTSSLDAGVLTYVYNRRRDAELRGLTYAVQKDTNLTIPAWSTNGVTEAGIQILNVDFEAVTNTVPTDVDVKFLKLLIEM